MNRIIFAVVIVLVIGVIGYLLISNRNSQKSITTKVISPTQAPSSTPTPLQVMVDLKELNRSGESGTATLSEQNGKVTVSFNIAGAPSGVVQPAHIHVGACPGVGSIKYPLSSLTDGKSETTLPDGVTFSTLKGSLPLAINVHKSSSQLGVYVACGSIEASSGAFMTITGVPLQNSTVTPTTRKISPTSQAIISPSPRVSATPIITP